MTKKQNKTKLKNKNKNMVSISRYFDLQSPGKEYKTESYQSHGVPHIVPEGNFINIIDQIVF